MESYRGFGRSRVLLPSEIQLIQALNCTEEEYWEFIRLNLAYTGERPKEYELVPNVQNAPVAGFIIQIVIGAALVAVSYLLAPKPKEPKQPRSLKTDDQTSRSKYTPQQQFDSIQQLASLGTTIPLVYCKERDSGTAGGVRVNSQLLFSYMTTLGRAQQLRALCLFSHGEIKGRPEYEGYAIGDLLLSSYAPGKSAVYFKPGLKEGGRFNQSKAGEQNQYPQITMEDLAGGQTRDPFAIEWGDDLVQYSSGTRTPSTQAQFGVYAPLPNGNRYKVNYELVLVPDDASGDIKDDQRRKKDKINAIFLRRAWLFNPFGNQPERNRVLPEGSEITYVITTDQQAADQYEPWGTEDVRQATNNGRFNIDNNLIVGETYMLGTGYAKLITKNGSPWYPDAPANTQAIFKCLTDCTVDLQVYDSADEPNILTIQRLALATITNTRPVNRTDILIKSVVWRQINGFPNVNSQPDGGVIDDYEDDNSSITLGSMNLYNKRFSFFVLQYRKIGESEWKTMSGDTGFAVEGRTPEAVYNMIKIFHPSTEAYQYQLAPLAGNAVNRFWSGKTFYFLTAASNFGADKQPVENYIFYGDTEGAWTITYTGIPRTYSQEEVSNGEWVVGEYNSPDVPSDRSLRFTDAVQDFIVYEAENMSNSTQPEHEVVGINEVVGDSSPPQFQNLAYAGVRLNSGVEWTSFNELSAYFLNGIKVTTFPLGTGLDATNLMPEITYDLLTNDDYGVGEYVGASQVDEIEMGIAAAFCRANGFFWDGVIGDKVNIREWIFENAAYCLLQFRIKGGRFSLFPDTPYNSSYEIDAAQPISPRAFFTDSNIRNLKVTFLSPEERQLFTAAVVTRKDTINGFPETLTTTIRLSNSAGGSEIDPVEKFDLSYFCASKEHGIKFAKYALKIRDLVDHGVQFETTPEEAMYLEPGEYFQLSTTVQHADSRSGSLALRMNNGSIDGDGNIIGVSLTDGTHYIQYWRPGTEGVQEAVINVSNQQVSEGVYRGVLFALSPRSGGNSRVYKVENLSYSDDGLVEVAGSFAPLTSGGQLKTLDWADSDFVII